MQTTLPLIRACSWLSITRRRWSSLGLRAKILISLILMMALSTVGSMGAFVVTTNATRIQLQDQQLVSDLERVEQLLLTRENDLRQAATLLAHDPLLKMALHHDQASANQPGDSLVVLDIPRRAVPIRDRFQIDQVLVIGPGGGVRANIVTNSSFSAYSFEETALISNLTSEGSVVRLLDTQPTLLVAYCPIDTGGAVITALALPDELGRVRHRLDLPSHIDLYIENRLRASSVAHGEALRPERQLEKQFMLGGQPARLLVSLENPEIGSIIAAGRTAMLLSVLTTFVLLLLLGMRFAYTITRPIRRLTRVADAVAAGDWNQRAALSFNDEIGRLGRAFDHAAQTITTLLGQRDQEASQRQAILQSITDGVVAVDAHGRLMLVNPAAQDVLGWRQPPIGMLLHSVLESDDLLDEGRRTLARLLDDVLQGDQMSLDHHVLLNGRDVRMSCAPIWGRDQDRLGAVAVLQDITEAVASDRAKTQFIATASHELRTPLAGIKGFTDLLYLQGLSNLTEDQRYALGIIRRQTDLLVTLVNDLLEVARLEQGQSEADRQILDPTKQVYEALAGFEAQVASAGHQLSIQIAENIPLLLINSSHLRRIVANLLSNAIKYTPDGGAITLRVLHRGSVVRLEVEDNGVGIAARDRDRIFQRFYRSENPLSVKAGGTGLGLSITKSLVELHGGRIGFVSEEGCGSCFWVEFPQIGIQSDSLDSQVTMLMEA